METKKVQLKTLMHDPDYYTKAFQAYSKRSGKLRARRQWVERQFPELVVKKMAESLPADTTIRMLGVGSGSGEMDSQMAAAIKTSFKAVENIVLEPSAKQLDIYQELIDDQNKEGGFEGINFDLRTETMDGYRAKLKEAGGEHPKYHFISAIHSLYYVDNLHDSLGYLYDHLEEGGILMTVCVAEKGGFWRLWDHFNGFQDDTSRYFCTRHFSEAHAAHSIAHEVIGQKSRVEITNCFNPESEEGRLIIDFLAHTVDLRGTAPPELYKEVVDYLGSENCSERLEDGNVLFSNDWDMFLAQKPVKAVNDSTN